MRRGRPEKTLLIKIVITILALVTISESASAQDYEFTLRQRRLFDQIAVELWAKANAADVPKIGYASLIVEYNSDYLTPAQNQNLTTTDSISSDIDASSPIINVSSNFSNQNGYGALGSQNYGEGYYSLEINLNSLGEGGVVPSLEGRGSFLGRLAFDIIDNPSESDLTEIVWSDDEEIRSCVVFDADSSEITPRVTFTAPGDFNIVGVTILSPNHSSQAVDLDKDYASLSGDYASSGYPIYFERSVSPADYDAPQQFPATLDEDLAYSFDYSLDAGENWKEIGRVAETNKASSHSGSQAQYRSGDIFNPASGGSYIIATQEGERIVYDNYRSPLRVIWKKNPYFIERSEQAKMRVSILNGDGYSDLPLRTVSQTNDESDAEFVLGRLFFLQLNGESQYLKTEESYSNATQLTVEAWINLNEYQPEGSEPAIIVSSLGPDASPINGSNEGSWILYLQDGRYPAFRVREIDGRGENGYLASLSDVIALQNASPVAPLSDAHSKNWVHIAATVDNNEAVLYVNGEIVDDYKNVSATDVRMLTTNHPIWIGVNPNDGIDGTDYLPAGIKEVQVWRTALTQEQIRQRTPGVVAPSDVEDYGDLKRSLELYYSFEGSLNDLANDADMQKGLQVVDYSDENDADSEVYYRPDMPHISLTAPVENAGVLNKEGEVFEIRWVSYGLGDIENGDSKDVIIEYSLDGGDSWDYAKRPDSEDIDDDNAPDIEDGKTYWEPWENDDSGFDLRTINPYSHNTILRIRGAESRNQDNLYDESGEFNVARYFALKRDENAIIFIDGESGFNLTSNESFIEAWARPYRFPTEEEGSFPIISKYGIDDGLGHYSLNLMPTGRLQFTVTDAAGVQRIALSDEDKALVRPNSVAIDTPWAHIGVYLVLDDGSGASEVRFFIDGEAQRGETVTGQLGNDLTVDALNRYPTYIGHQAVAGEAGTGFIGEIREIRFWKGSPNNTTATGAEPTETTEFIQGALTARAGDLGLDYRSSLFSSFSFNGGAFIENGYSRAIGSKTNPLTIIRFYNGEVSFTPTKPYFKIAEPAFKQKVANTDTDVKVRWVGFDYNGTGFTAGKQNVAPSLEFSIRGGGGNLVQPYQYLGGKYWDGTQEQSISFPETESYKFEGEGEEVYIAAQVDFSVADPDLDNDGTFRDQGPISAALVNARLRLTGDYIINGETDTITVEGPIFTITPETNFTIRTLLEGRHDGAVSGRNLRDLGSTYSTGGLKIKLYTDNKGSLGVLVDSAESIYGYDGKDPANLKNGNNRFANVNFVFTDLTDDDYWVVVDHINHLPIMSRFAAPFVYEGDVISTWEIESGWDFTSWNGEDENVLLKPDDNPWEYGAYTAYGDAYSTSTKEQYSTTGLIYSGGAAGGSSYAMPAMVGGDVNQDNQINAADRVRVRLDAGSGLVRSDVTGDGYVNADDRTIVDRNFGKISSIHDVDFPQAQEETEDLIVGGGKDERNYEFANSKKIVNKKENTLAGGIKYVVTAEPLIRRDTVHLSLYIKNVGVDFGLANATFGVDYNPTVMEFIDLTGKDSVVFRNDTASGYAELKSAPSSGATIPIPNLRTIEVDYDARSNKPGINVPRAETYLGTLRFALESKKNAVVLKWHEITSVHTTDSVNVTEEGIFEDIEPLILYDAEVAYPNGGEGFSANKEIQIRWQTDGTAPAFIQYSNNGGYNWTFIGDTVNVKDGICSWTTPNSYGSDYLIRILDAQTMKELDRSDDEFAILRSRASIIKPSAYDPLYKAGERDSIIWETVGYERLKIEFTGDGGASWFVLDSNVSASDGFMLWDIPSVTTKSAIVRLVDMESGSEIARSGEFKILRGYIDFIKPRRGDSLWLGSVEKLKWNYRGVARFDMQVSENGGASWRTIEDSVFALDGEYDWRVDNAAVSDNCLLRAIWNGDSDMSFGKSDVFRIVSSTDVEYSKIDDSFGEFYPNPCSGIAKLYFETRERKLIRIDVVNSLGETLNNIGPVIYNKGYNIIELDLNEFPEGIYYVKIESENYKIIRKISFIK